MVAPGTSLSAIAEQAGTTVDVIRRLNPQLRRDHTRDDRADTVRVPKGHARVTPAR
jgi:LysM repeat protein